MVKARQIGGGTLVVVLALVLAACGGSSSSTGASRPTSWTTSQACSRWKDLSAPTVSAYNSLDSAYLRQKTTGATSWQTVKKDAVAYGSATQRLDAELASPPQPWPAPLAQAVPALRSFGARTVTWSEAVGTAKSEGDFARLYAKAPFNAEPSADYTAAGDAVRQACQLPSPTAPDATVT